MKRIHWLALVAVSVLLLSFGFHVAFMDKTISNALKEFSGPRTTSSRKMEIVTFLRQATVTKQDKPILKAALQSPQYAEIHNHLELCLLHGIQDYPEESDKELLLDRLQKGQGLGWLIYAVTVVCDERYVPYLTRYIQGKPRSVAAIEAVMRIQLECKIPVPEAIQPLVEAMNDDNPAVTNAAHNALFSLTGKRYFNKFAGRESGESPNE